jgi:hypothetical protein
MTKIENVPDAPIGCPALVEFINPEGSFGGEVPCSSRRSGKCGLRFNRAIGYRARTVERPCAIEEDTRTSGDKFVHQFNKFIWESDNESGRYMISHQLFAPVFDVVIEYMRAQDQYLNYYSIVLSSILYLHDQLENEREDELFGPSYMIKELGRVSTFVSENQAVLDLYKELKFDESTIE